MKNTDPFELLLLSATYFQLLLEELKNEERYLPLRISFENLKPVDKQLFYQALHYRIRGDSRLRRLFWEQNSQI